MRWLKLAVVVIVLFVRNLSGEWRPFPSLIQARYGAGAVVVGDSLLVIGGETISGHPHRQRRISTVEVLNSSGGTWHFGEPLPEPRAFFGVGTIGDTIFLLGGIDSLGMTSDDIFAFLPDSSAWVHFGHLPFPLAHFSMVRIGRRFFIFGGWLRTVGSLNPYILIFDPSQNLWDSIMIPAWVPRVDMGAAALGDTVLLFGGTYFGQLNWITSFFDSTVSDFDTLPIPLSGMSIAQDGTVVYVISGLSNWHERRTAWRFLPSSRTWVELPELHFRRSYASAVMFDNHLFVIGGKMEHRALCSVEYLELQSIEEEPSPVSPKKFDVIAPNPLTYGSRITVYAPFESEIRVYSSNGSLVFKRELNPGMNSLIWKRIDLPSGVYFYKIGNVRGKWLYLRR